MKAVNAREARDRARGDSDMGSEDQASMRRRQTSGTGSFSMASTASSVSRRAVSEAPASLHVPSDIQRHQRSVSMAPGSKPDLDIDRRSNVSEHGSLPTSNASNAKVAETTSAKPRKTFLSRFGLAPSRKDRSLSVSESSERSPSIDGLPVSESPGSVHSLIRGDSIASFDSVGSTSAFSNSGRRPRPVKVRAKNKAQKNFRHLFLAQELVFHSDTPLTSVFPPSDAQSFDSKSMEPNPSHDSLPLSSESHGSAPVQPHQPIRHKKPSVWAMQFSRDGKYLAAAGHDGVVRVWQVLSTPEEREAATSRPTLPRGGSILSPASDATASAPPSMPNTPSRKKSGSHLAEVPVFSNRPLHEYHGHTADVLDLSWSKVRQDQAKF